MYIESVSKLYNDLTLINKIKTKEFENDVQSLKMTDEDKKDLELNKKSKKQIEGKQGNGTKTILEMKA